MTAQPGRVRAIDWLRGIAVLVMIQTHALSLLRPELRAGTLFNRLQWMDGLVAPAFIFSAGFALALTQVRAALAPASAGPSPRARRLRRTLRRLGEVLVAATLVNWMWFPIWREPKWIVRVDILQCIGLSLLIALPALFLLATRPRALSWVSLALAAIAFGIAPLLEHVPPPLGGFLNVASGAVFPLVPWGGYVYLGAAAGAATASRGARACTAFLIGLALAGVLLWVLTPQLTAIYPPHQFWVTNPANHARRWTQVCLVALALLGLEKLRGTDWGPAAPVRFFIEAFGTSSLAAYSLHEMLLYFEIAGFSFHRVWGDRCTWAAYWPLLGLLVAATFALTLVADLLYRRVDRILSGPPPAPPAAAPQPAR